MRVKVHMRLPLNVVSTSGGPIEYCQSQKIDTGRAYTATNIRQTSKCGYAVGTGWKQEKKRTLKATHIPGRFTGDESQLE